MNKAEYPMLGVVLCEYRDAVLMVDACLLAATDISKTVDPNRAATIEACRLAIMEVLTVGDGLLAGEKRKAS